MAPRCHAVSEVGGTLFFGANQEQVPVYTSEDFLFLFLLYWNVSSKKKEYVVAIFLVSALWVNRYG